MTSPLDVTPYNLITYIDIKSDMPFKGSTKYGYRRLHRYFSNVLSQKTILFIVTSAEPRILHVHALFESDSVS